MITSVMVKDIAIGRMLKCGKLFLIKMERGGGLTIVSTYVLCPGIA